MMNTKFFLAFSSIVCKRSQALLVLMTEESGWLIPDSQGPTITLATAVGVKYKSSESSHPQRQAVRDPQRQVSDQPSTKASCLRSTKTSCQRAAKTSQRLAIHKDQSMISHPQGKFSEFKSRKTWGSHNQHSKLSQVQTVNNDQV